MEFLPCAQEISRHDIRQLCIRDRLHPLGDRKRRQIHVSYRPSVREASRVSKVGRSLVVLS